MKASVIVKVKNPYLVLGFAGYIPHPRGKGWILPIGQSWRGTRFHAEIQNHRILLHYDDQIGTIKNGYHKTKLNAQIFAEAKRLEKINEPPLKKKKERIVDPERAKMYEERLWKIYNK